MNSKEVAMLGRSFRAVKRSAGGPNARDAGLVTVINRTGNTLAEGDVVTLSTANNRSVVFGGLAAPGPMVVVVGGVNGEEVRCARRGYGPVTITCSTPAVTPGDALVSSATARRATTDNDATPRSFLGLALTAKGEGVGSVTVLL